MTQVYKHSTLRTSVWYMQEPDSCLVLTRIDRYTPMVVPKKY